MDWRIEFSQTAAKQFEKLERAVQVRIRKFLRERLLKAKNPRELGKALHGEKAGMWRYRLGDYRLICDIRDEVVIILVLYIAHRKDVYR